MKADAGLPDEEIRELFVQFLNCNHEGLARRYALAMLRKSLQKIYSGEIVIIGNPDIKPVDICYVFDEYNDVVGPVEVRRVVHTFSQETGFITEITPDLFVTCNEYANMTLADAIGIAMEGSLSAMYGNTRTSPGDILVGANKALGAGLGLAGAQGVGAATFSNLFGFSAAFMGPLGLMAGGAAVFGLGTFLQKRVIDFTNAAQPLMMHPLMHNGSTMIAGLPIRKLQSTWSTGLGKFIKDGKDGFNLLLEDWYDNLVLAPTQGNLTNWRTGDSLGPKF